MASHSTRSPRSARHDPPMESMAERPPPLAGTAGMPRAAPRPTSENTTSRPPASQGELPTAESSGPAAAVPAMIARKVHISRAPLPIDRRSWGSSSGSRPYLAGLNTADCTPMSASTISAEVVSPGSRHSTHVPSDMSTSSKTLLNSTMLRLL